MKLPLPHIVFTGGGTAGHVTPNLALIEVLRHKNWQMDYIGSRSSLEETMIGATTVRFHPIHTGKLRRYFSWQNFVDPFKIILGVVQSYRLLGKLKTNIVFSKGGFVSFPVVLAAWLRKIPVVVHESDMSPGLANRLSLPFVHTVCLNFSGSKVYYKKSIRLEVTGTPIRLALFNGDRNRGLKRLGFLDNKPCLLIMGGSLGSAVINGVVRKALERLTQGYQIIHLCGRGNIDKNLIDHPGYMQLEYANAELADLFAAASMVISRSGANALYEILVLKKPHILIPLSTKASRGDQIENAEYFRKQGISIVIDEENLSTTSLVTAIETLSVRQEEITNKITSLGIDSGTLRIIEILEQILGLTPTFQGPTAATRKKSVY